MMKFLISLFLLMTLSACGFHLRGDSHLPPELHALHLQTNTKSDFTKELSSKLNTSGVHLTQTAKEAPLVLHVIDESVNRQLNSISSNAQLRYYTLAYSVHYQLLDKHNRQIIAPQVLTTSRHYSVNPHQLLGSQNEENTLIKEMQEELVSLLMNRLNAESVRTALHHRNDQ